MKSYIIGFFALSLISCSGESEVLPQPTSTTEVSTVEVTPNTVPGDSFYLSEETYMGNYTRLVASRKIYVDGVNPVIMDVNFTCDQTISDTDVQNTTRMYVDVLDPSNDQELKINEFSVKLDSHSPSSKDYFKNNYFYVNQSSSPDYHISADLWTIAALTLEGTERNLVYVNSVNGVYESSDTDTRKLAKEAGIKVSAKPLEDVRYEAYKKYQSVENMTIFFKTALGQSGSVNINMQDDAIFKTLAACDKFIMEEY